MAHFYKRYRTVDNGVRWTPELRLGPATLADTAGALVGAEQESEEECDAVIAAVAADLALKVVRDISAPESAL